MSAEVVLGAALVVFGAVLLAASTPALGRVGRDQPWTVRLVGNSPGVAALSAVGTGAGGLGGVILWHEFGLAALVAVVAALVVPQVVVARVRQRRGARR